MSDTFNVTLNDSFTVTVDGGTSRFNISLTNAVTSSSPVIEENAKLYLDGAGGTTYLMFNSTTQRVELWVKGEKVQEW